jgi:hypothetical protein
MLRTSEELRALGESLQRLTISNESLSMSNKTLTDILYFREQSLKQTLDLGIATLASSTKCRSPFGPNGRPFVSAFAFPDLPRTDPPGSQQSTPSDSTHDYLQQCMDYVHELANTIACAMSAWQGKEKTGNSDIHGSHAKLVAALTTLPIELECGECLGRVTWSHFDLSRAATECLGTCTCVDRTMPMHWRPSASNAPHLRHTPSASPHPPYNQSFADSNPLSTNSFHGLGAADQMSPPEISIDYAPPAGHNHVNPRPSSNMGDGETLSPPRKLRLVMHEIILTLTCNPDQSRPRSRAKSDSYAKSRPTTPSISAGRGRSSSLQPPTSSGYLAPSDNKSVSSR